LLDEAEFAASERSRDRESERGTSFDRVGAEVVDGRRTASLEHLECPLRIGYAEDDGSDAVRMVPEESARRRVLARRHGASNAAFAGLEEP
jgi:hypothetical protein